MRKTAIFFSGLSMFMASWTLAKDDTSIPRAIPLTRPELKEMIENMKQRTARIPLMGVRREFHHTRFGPGLALSVVEALRAPGLRMGVQEVEMSWILESNEAMKNIIDILGGRQSKRYRVYEKTLG